MQKTHLLTTLLVAALAFMPFSPAHAVKKGDTAPDFTLKSRSGKNLRLADFRGKVVMINFWATWCAPCRQELPHLNALYKKYKSKGFVLLGVNLDNDPAAARKMADEFKVSFPVLFDPEQKTGKLYRLKAMPSTVILNRSGKVRHVHLGYKPGYEKEYDKQVRRLVAR